MPASPRHAIEDVPTPLPWRVLVAVPPGGFGGQLMTMRTWLDHYCTGGWAAAPAGLRGVVNDAVAFYFADRAAASAFIGRFSCGYRSGSRTAL